MENDGYKTLEDLVFSSSFRNWVLRKDTPESDFWADWQTRNPDKQELINQAKAIIYALQLDLRPLEDDVVDDEITRVLDKLHQGRFNFTTELPDAPRRSRRFSRGWAVAAIFAGVAILIWSVRLYLNRQQDGLRSFLAEHRAAKVRERTGTTDSFRILILPDGSTVRLSPGSKIFFPEKLMASGSGAGGASAGASGSGAATASAGASGSGSAAGSDAGHRREVFLEGDAFFDIAHDATNPFYVYTHQLVTKVLGTSFRISSGAGAKMVVAVSTGKISVYRRSDLTDGVILTPNQQITYDAAEDRLDRSVTQRPQVLAGASDTSLVFNSTPISTVFHRLQAIYGIPIIYDEESISGCSLNVTMGHEPFYEKLNIICKAIGATYESIDGTIVVTARGCK